MGMISSYLWVAMGAPLLVIFLLIFIRRWRYTDMLRNKRYWNKQIFEGKGQKITVPSCAQLSEGVGSAFQQAQGAISGVQGAISGAQGVGIGPPLGGN
jgi:hypothetical protein